MSGDASSETEVDDIRRGRIHTVTPTSRATWYGGEGIIFNLDNLAEADPHDIQKIAASQIELMTVYHNVVLDQARRSFLWAIISGAIGVIFFIAAVTFSLLQQPENAAVISAIGGAIAELIAATFLYLYGKTTTQLTDFHKRLDVTQRHLLANSIAASMDGDGQKEARLELIRTIARIEVGEKKG